MREKERARERAKKERKKMRRAKRTQARKATRGEKIKNVYCPFNNPVKSLFLCYEVVKD